MNINDDQGQVSEIVCPKCLSNQISANQRGFNTAASNIGFFIGGKSLATNMGMSGSEDES